MTQDNTATVDGNKTMRLELVTQKMHRRDAAKGGK
jgi:hypothetical protein